MIPAGDLSGLQTSLAHEFRELCRVHGFDRDDILGFIDNAVTACWLHESEKAELREQLASAPGR